LLLVAYLEIEKLPTKLDIVPTSNVLVLPHIPSNPKIASYKDSFFWQTPEALMILENDEWKEVELSGAEDVTRTSPKVCMIGTKVYSLHPHPAYGPSNPSNEVLRELDLETLSWKNYRTLLALFVGKKGEPKSNINSFLIAITLPPKVTWNEFMGRGTTICNVGKKLVFFDRRTHTFIYNTGTWTFLL